MIAVTGLRAEARLATGEGIEVLSGGGDGAALERALTEAVLSGAIGLISFGVAGGLAPSLAPGDCLVGGAVLTERGERFLADPAWARGIAAALGAPIVDIAGVDSPLTDSAGKSALHFGGGAHAVDMESHIVARVAHAHRLPFAAFRVIADPAERGLPHAALVAMKPGGGLALGALALSLLRDPRQIAGLVQTAIDARAAFKSLFRGRQLLGRALGFSDFGELVLDMAGENELGGTLPI